MLVPLAGIGASAQSPSAETAPLDPTNPVIAELIAATVRYANGRDNAWWTPPAETRHL